MTESLKSRRDGQGRIESMEIDHERVTNVTKSRVEDNQKT